ncbi:hypothetical protein EVAR_95154_1, partial [Eumeta japonica]
MYRQIHAGYTAGDKYRLVNIIVVQKKKGTSREVVRRLRTADCGRVMRENLFSIILIMTLIIVKRPAARSHVKTPARRPKRSLVMLMRLEE